jgi:hypothetical protein
MPVVSRIALRWAAVALLVVLGVTPSASAQLVVPFVPELDDVPVNPMSYAEFVDGAVPLSFVRTRVDAAYNSNRPTRAEFFMPAEGKNFRGLPLTETRVDYQEVHTYAEYAFSPIFSAFIDAPARFLNPTVNRNHFGASDLQIGAKYSFLQQGPLVATAQLRTYFPTGDASKGLGTGHGSAEPGLLFLYQGSPKWRVESEIMVLVPINDEKYGGEVIRYGSAFSYGERNPEGFWFTPVVEGQGWSVVRGRESVLRNILVTTRTRGITTKTLVPTTLMQTAVGDAIFNGDVGVRAGWGTVGDIYVGYSRALTGDVWYKDMFRVELRWFY